MRTALTLMLAAATTSGCIVYDNFDNDVPGPAPGPGPVLNAPPVVLDAYAGVYFDDYYYDDIWVFEATVDDADGPLDVIEVFADVYDDRTGVLVDSFELFPAENDPFFWYSDWYGSSTFLDPFYRNYSVDIIAYDAYEGYDAVTVWADTY